MTDKIKELTEKIYNEGVIQAKADAEQLIAEATEKANEIVNSAKKSKEEILEEAKQQALEIKKSSNSELQLAAQQFTSQLKQKITNFISAPQRENLIKDAFEDIEFVKKLIFTTVQNWNPEKQEEIDLKILLPEKQKKELNSFLEDKMFSELNKRVAIEFDSKTKSGFKIGPKDGNYTISFNENDFENFFKSYFRERTKKLLFESES